MDCKLVNRGSGGGGVKAGHPLARVIALNAHDTPRFYNLFDDSRVLLTDMSPGVSVSEPAPTIAQSPLPAARTTVHLASANFGQFSASEQEGLPSILGDFKELLPETRCI